MHTVTNTSMARKTFQLLVLGSSLFFIGSLCAGGDNGLKVYSALTQVQDGAYQLNAQLEYGLTQAALDALESGVPLTFELEVDVVKPRKWLWNNVLASYDQRYQVAYHALTQQYIVTNLSSGVQNSYSNRKTALLTMGRINNYTLFEEGSLKIEKGYFGRLRISLLINELPAPMRPWAYINSDWNLASEWFVWELK